MEKLAHFEKEPFEVFDREWALVTAGTMEDYNTMTISWGGMGTLWNLPVATVYVKPVRNTFNYLESNEYFTVSFFGEEYRRDLATLGTLSGRDGDKVAKTGLTAVQAGDSVTFRQAEITLVCKKIYRQDLDVSKIPQEAVNKYYLTEAPHRMFIGHVVEVIKK